MSALELILFFVYFVVSSISHVVVTRTVQRYEVPRLTLQLTMLAPGLFALGSAFFFEFGLKPLVLLTGGALTFMGVIGLAALLWSTRLSGLQPRVTPIDLSSESRDTDSIF